MRYGKHEWIYKETARRIIDSPRTKSQMLLVLDSTPPVEEEDRPPAEWILDSEGKYICSRCKIGYKEQPTCMGKPMYSYCPCCGAIMGYAGMLIKEDKQDERII